jgi:alkylation response protein AidB-like acyl-CoA dehydrogenase
MDFTLNDDQTAIVALAARILGDRCTPEALAAAEAAGDRFDAELWALLARADLLGLCLPEADGGGGYGVLEAALLCQEVGRTAAPVPLWSTLLLGALPLARHGSDALRAEVLPRVADGSLVLTAAVVEDGSPLPPDTPLTTATPDSTGGTGGTGGTSGTGWRLSGTKHVVPTVHLAGAGVDVRVLVPARTGNGATTVFLVDPAAAGVTVTRGLGTDLEPLSSLSLDDLVLGPDAVVGEVDGGAEVVATITALGTAGICARQAGTCDAALRTAATYTSEREQFGAKIATFQAVAHRLADAYIDTEAIRLTSIHAAWLLDEGRPADDALAVAKVWATEGAQRVVHGAQHVHGGIGVDTDYPLHRWFRAAKAAEHTLGTVHPHLVALGSRIVGAA